MAPLTAKEKEFILCMCRNDLHLARTARELHYHKSTILYKARRIEEKTGYSPTSFVGALRLLEMIHQDVYSL